ncbi:MAG: tetratricopeptide repeat protein [Pseudomonadota bacterium]
MPGTSITASLTASLTAFESALQAAAARANRTAQARAPQDPEPALSLAPHTPMASGEVPLPLSLLSPLETMTQALKLVVADDLPTADVAHLASTSRTNLDDLAAVMSARLATQWRGIVGEALEGVRRRLGDDWNHMENWSAVARALANFGLLDLATRVAGAIPAGTPHHFEAQHFLALIQQRTTKGAEAGLRQALRASRMRPDDDACRMTLARAYVHAGHPREAAAVLQDMKKVDLVTRALVEQACGRPHVARALLDSAIAHAEACFARKVRDFQVYETGRAAYRARYGSAPGHPAMPMTPASAHRNAAPGYAKVCASLGDWTGARQWIEEAVRLKSANLSDAVCYLLQRPNGRTVPWVNALRLEMERVVVPAGLQLPRYAK